MFINPNLSPVEIVRTARDLMQVSSDGLPRPTIWDLEVMLVRSSYPVAIAYGEWQVTAHGDVLPFVVQVALQSPIVNCQLYCFGERGHICRVILVEGEIINFAECLNASPSMLAELASWTIAHTCIG